MLNKEIYENIKKETSSGKIDRVNNVGGYICKYILSTSKSLL